MVCKMVLPELSRSSLDKVRTSALATAAPFGRLWKQRSRQKPSGSDMILADYCAMRAYLLAACLAAPSILKAQNVDPRLAPILEGSVGKVVRVGVDSGNSLMTGAIERVRGDTLFLVSTSGSSQTLSVRRITRVDVREPVDDDRRLRRTRLGIVAGFLVGTGIGYLIAVPKVRHEQAQHNQYADLYYLSEGVFGGLVGALIGGASGSARPDHWVTRYPLVE